MPNSKHSVLRMKLPPQELVHDETQDYSDQGSCRYEAESKDTVRSLGLHKIHQSVIREDTPVVRGMIRTVAHLVTVEEVA